MASAEYEYECFLCGNENSTGIRRPSKCEECESREIYVIFNNLEEKE